MFTQDNFPHPCTRSHADNNQQKDGIACWLRPRWLIRSYYIRHQRRSATHRRGGGLTDDPAMIAVDPPRSRDVLLHHVQIDGGVAHPGGHPPRPQAWQRGRRDSRVSGDEVPHAVPERPAGSDLAGAYAVREAQHAVGLIPTPRPLQRPAVDGHGIHSHHRSRRRIADSISIAEV